MTIKPMSVWIGFDPRETAAFMVARESVRHFDRSMPISAVRLRHLQEEGLYMRPTTRRLGKLWDEISGAHMATEFAITRFLVPELVRRQNEDVRGWALFMDCDVLVRANLYELKALLDDSKAVMCVKHDHRPSFNVKMDGQEQTSYPRKNWSSVMAINVDHPANDALDATLVNARPGRDLHGFCWLDDSDIGALPAAWNYLVGHTEDVRDPKIVHFTDGGPWFEGFRNVPYADEWFAVLDRMVA
jgi:lipopolysaccharide biosynthesis glycosyltransferase